MKIHLECCCGAKLDLVDESRTYIIPGGTTNKDVKDGKVYTIELMANSWKKDHGMCPYYKFC